MRHGAHVYRARRRQAAFKNVQFKSGNKTYDLYDYVSLNRVSGLLVLKDGKIVRDVSAGQPRNHRWMSMSVVKSMTGTLIGAAIKDGFIHSIDDPLTRYVAGAVGQRTKASASAIFCRWPQA